MIISPNAIEFNFRILHNFVTEFAENARLHTLNDAGPFMDIPFGWFM